MNFSDKVYIYQYMYRISGEEKNVMTISIALLIEINLIFVKYQPFKIEKINFIELHMFSCLFTGCAFFEWISTLSEVYYLKCYSEQNLFFLFFLI